VAQEQRDAGKGAGSGVGGSGAAGRGVIEGALTLLEEITRVGEAGLTELAAAAGLPKTTAHRLLDQLVEEGAAERQGSRYRIGARMFRLSEAYAPAKVLGAAARQPLRELSAVAPGANVTVSVPERGRTVVVTGLRGEVDAVFPIDAGTVVWHGNTGDRFFAPHDPEAVEATCPEGFSAARWGRMVAEARERGVAFDYEADMVPLVSCVSAPVYAPSGAVVGVVAAILLENQRLLRPLGSVVRRTADLVSRNIAGAGIPEPAPRSWLGGTTSRPVAGSS
jgi:DNA-binding IclR family transcriptional regulator